jgi:hypothetical protein
MRVFVIKFVFQKKKSRNFREQKNQHLTKFYEQRKRKTRTVRIHAGSVQPISFSFDVHSH